MKALGKALLLSSPSWISIVAKPNDCPRAKWLSTLDAAEQYLREMVLANLNKCTDEGTSEAKSYLYSFLTEAPK